MHLGTLSPTQLAVEPITFDWYEEQNITTNEGLSELLLADFLDTFKDLDVDNVETASNVLVGLKDLARGMVSAEDFPRFWAATRQHGAGTKDVMALMKSIIEAVAARPTGLPSDSTDGQSTAPTNSAPTPEWIAASVLPGRPDLQAQVMAAQHTA